MAGDLISNTLYYSLAGLGNKKNLLLRGSLLGALAGIGAVLLPRPLGLNETYSNRTTKTKFMTVGLYLFGGIVAAEVIHLLKRDQK
jgi:H+/Cl- antiporter ClcA